ncbi:MAG: MlaD family protein [Fibrobacterales bacterium]
MNRNDTVFYIGVAAIVFIVGFLYIMYHPNSPRFGTSKYSILSTEIHTLALGSDVTVNGLANGEVLSFEQAGEYIQIQAAIDDRIAIPIDSKVFIRNNGLLGERVLAVLLGESKSVYTPGSTIYASSDKGTSGLARQAQALIGQTQGVITTLMGALDSVVFSDESKNALVRVKQKAQQLIDRANTVARESESTIVSTIESIEYGLNTIERQIAQFDHETVSEDFNQVLQRSELLIGKLERLSDIVEEEKIKAMTQQNSLGKALFDPGFHKNLESLKISAFKVKDVILAQELTINVDF